MSITPSIAPPVTVGGPAPTLSPSVMAGPPPGAMLPGMVGPLAMPSGPDPFGAPMGAGSHTSSGPPGYSWITGTVDPTPAEIVEAAAAAGTPVPPGMDPVMFSRMMSGDPTAIAMGPPPIPKAPPLAVPAATAVPDPVAPPLAVTTPTPVIEPPTTVAAPAPTLAPSVVAPPPPAAVFPRAVMPTAPTTPPPSYVDPAAPRFIPAAGGAAGAPMKVCDPITGRCFSK